MKHPLRTLVAVVVAGLLAIVVACGPAPRPTLVATLPDPSSALTVKFDDRSGWVKRIAIIHPVPEWAIRPQPGITVVERDPNAVWIRWLGGDCPTEVSMSLIAGAVTSLLRFDGGQRCQHDVGIPRVLLVEFDQPVSATSISVVTPSPPPG
jgi:hypothetical protein